MSNKHKNICAMEKNWYFHCHFYTVICSVCCMCVCVYMHVPTLYCDWQCWFAGVILWVNKWLGNRVLYMMQI